MINACAAHSDSFSFPNHIKRIQSSGQCVFPRNFLPSQAKWCFTRIQKRPLPRKHFTKLANAQKMVFCKDGFPLLRNLYKCKCIKFTFANKIEPVYECLSVNIKDEPNSTSCLAQHFIYCLVCIIFMPVKFCRYMHVKIHP